MILPSYNELRAIFYFSLICALINNFLFVHSTLNVICQYILGYVIALEISFIMMTLLRKICDSETYEYIFLLFSIIIISIAILDILIFIGNCLSFVSNLIRSDVATVKSNFKE